ncbi:transposase [Bacteroidia bacterium]|nr:transposase [Bacteroidia bacterium]
MATFKAIVKKHHKKQDGTYNVKIRVTHAGIVRFLSTNLYVTAEDLTRSVKLKNQKYIDVTDNIIKNCRNLCNDNATILGKMNVDDVVKLVSDIISGRQQNTNDNNFDLNFVRYGREHIQTLKSENHTGNARSYENALNNLEKFVGRSNISIHEITATFIKDWINWIKQQSAARNMDKGGRAESLYPSNIRALHNKAKNEFNDEDLGIIRIPLSPFKRVKLPSLPEHRERALEVEQIRKICELPDRKIVNKKVNNRFNFARDMFVLSFGLIGMNAADLYNCDEYNNGRITYKRKKVTNRRADKAKISIKVEPELQELVNRYRDPDKKRVFCFYKMYSNENTFSSAINGRKYDNTNSKIKSFGLKEIGKIISVDDLEFYAARHSWASIALNNVGIDKYTVHTALNHVIEEMKVTDMYIKKDWTQIDKANRKVLDYVFHFEKS